MIIRSVEQAGGDSSCGGVRGSRGTVGGVREKSRTRRSVAEKLDAGSRDCRTTRWWEVVGGGGRWWEVVGGGGSE
jgi:hypothetical protein